VIEVSSIGSSELASSVAEAWRNCLVAAHPDNETTTHLQLWPWPREPLAGLPLLQRGRESDHQGQWPPLTSCWQPWTWEAQGSD